MNDGAAASHWRQELEAWVLPQELLDNAPESPYGWPSSLWRRRAEAALASDASSMGGGPDALPPLTPTRGLVSRLAGPSGTILDIGAGTGRASLPLAQAGHPVTAIEPNPSMLAGLRGTSVGLPVTVVEGSWPESAVLVEPHRVAMCAHVVFDVTNIGPFLAAMSDHGSAGVVIEMTDRHPWVHLGPYYQALHGLDRPFGPNWEDLVNVVKEVVEVEPQVEHWERPSDLWFESVEEILEFYGRRLLIGSDRWSELETLLEPDIIKGADGLQVGVEGRSLVTIWW